MKILLLTPEHPLQVPIGKGSSVGRNVEGLAEAYARMGHEVRVAFPCYHPPENMEGWVPAGAVQASFLKVEETQVWKTSYGPVQMRMLRHPLFERNHPYLEESGWDHLDNALRFAVFGAAALLSCLLDDWTPDLVHGHEWQSGLGILYATTFFKDELKSPRTLFTFQDAAFQGLCDSRWLPEIGLGPEWMAPERLEFWGRINLLKAGLVCAERVTVSSNHYLNALLEDHHGYGLEGLFRQLGSKVQAIPPGIDPGLWTLPFDLEDMVALRRWKAQQREQYAPGTRPLVAYASPFIPEAGVEHMLTVLPDFLKMDLELGFYGGESAPQRKHLETVARLHPGRIHILPSGEASLFHLLSASDMVMLPAVHQPSGTVYAKAMAVGTPCIAHRVGSAADRIVSHPAEQADGFLFDGLAPDTLLRTLRKVLVIRSNEEEWDKICSRGVTHGYFWDVAAERILGLL
ncbi:MAG: glycogen synthase GlgA [Fibrobacterota bacterium]|jgi:starch synthase